MRRRLLCGLVFLALAPATACAAPTVGRQPQPVQDRYVPEPPGWRAADWVIGLEAPWSLVFLPDGRALVSERPGHIRLIGRDGRLAPRAYAEIDVNAQGEGGLMGLAVHPQFPDPPHVYAMRTARHAGGLANQVIRIVHEGETGQLDRVVVAGIPGARNHNGGRIAFGPDGMLYIAAGETFRPELAQDIASLGGKILRVTAEGEVPPDNPFPGSPIWSLGHRNPQGLAWHPRTGELFAAEHGPSGEFGLRAWDEVNVIRPGANYGWPQAVGAVGRRGLVDPIVAWGDHTTPPGGIAFRGESLFVATLRSQALIRLDLQRDGERWSVRASERWFAEGPADGRYGRLRDVVLGPDNALYVLTNNRDGRGTPARGDDRILRLAPGG